MKVTDAIAKMRENGYSEDEIFKAIAKKPEMVDQYRAEKQDALLSRKLPEGMEDLQGQAHEMARHKWTVGLDEDLGNLKNFATGAADVAGRVTNAMVPGGLVNKGMNALGVDTSGQDRLPASVRVPADTLGAMGNPANIAAAGIGGAVASRIMGAAPATQGAMQTIGRFLAGTGGKAAGGAVAGAGGQGIDEAAGGFQPGWQRRTVEGGLLGGALGAAGGAAQNIGEGLQNTKGVRARNYASLGVDEARAVVAKGEPPIGSPGYRDYEAAVDVLKAPQGGKAARLGMDVENASAHPDVGAAYQRADDAARLLPRGVAGPQPPPVDVTALYRELSGVAPDGRTMMRAPAAEAQMKQYADLMDRFGAERGPGGTIVMPPDRVNELKKIVGNKGAWASVPGVTPSDFAGADAQARAANSRFYGEADRLKAQQEVARERSRAAMGLREEPGIAREDADAHRLESYMQPKIHGGHYGVVGNVTANAQALSGTAPVQSIARFMSGAGQQLSQPQLAPAASEAMQNWMAQKQRHSAIIDTIFDKKKPQDGQEAQNGVRQ